MSLFSDRVERTYNLANSGSYLPICNNIRSLLTYFPQTATIDCGSIPNGTQVTAAVNRSDDMSLRIYFIRDGKLGEI